MVMRDGDPRNGNRYRRLRQHIYATHTTCWLCGTHVDQTLPHAHRMARTVDHITPINKGGDCLDPTNCRLAHRACNSSRQDKPAQPTPPHQHRANW